LGGLLNYLLRCLLIALPSTALVVWLSTLSNVGTITLTARLIAIGFALAGGLVYFLVAWVLKIPESHLLVQFVLDSLRRSNRGARG
jgi:hypothetical protein